MPIETVLLAAVTFAAAVVAMSLRNLVHCTLALAMSLAGLAAIYLQLNAQFVGFAQILVYVGAVAILIVFAILLTRGNEPERPPLLSPRWGVGAVIAVAVFALLAGIILSSKAITRDIPQPPRPTVRQIGDHLMNQYILPLEVLGLLLTAALIGAVLIAMQEKEAE